MGVGFKLAYELVYPEPGRMVKLDTLHLHLGFI